MWKALVKRSSPWVPPLTRRRAAARSLAARARRMAGSFPARKTGEELGGDCGRGGEVGIGDKRLVDLMCVVGVVGAAGELDEAASTEVGAVGRALVAEVAAVVVEVEGVAAGRGVVDGGRFGEGEERLGFGADGGEGHEEHGFVGEVCGGEGGQDGREIGGDVGDWSEREELVDEVGGDGGRLERSGDGRHMVPPPGGISTDLLKINRLSLDLVQKATLSKSRRTVELNAKARREAGLCG